MLLAELQFEKHWVRERKKAAQGRIRIVQERERIVHRALIEKDNVQHRSDVWQTMEDDILPRVAEKARDWCIRDLHGKKYVKQLMTEMFQTSLAECQHLLYNKTFNVQGCQWQAVNEVPGIIMSPVAWTNVSTGESIKYQKMTGVMCKKIVIERHVSTEIEKVRQDFMKRRAEENDTYLQIKATLMCQAAFRMRCGRKLTMRMFQNQWICLVDCLSGTCLFYNTRERTTIDHPPYMLHRGQHVAHYSTFNARGPTTSVLETEQGQLIPSGSFWYEHRPRPYRPEKPPQSISWQVPSGLMLCERCSIGIVRRRCLGRGCIDDRTCSLYLCFYCYDEFHPPMPTGDESIDFHRLHKHVNYVSPSREDFLCCICESQTARMYCRDGECSGNLYCRSCYTAVHMHDNEHWHVPDEIHA